MHCLRNIQSDEHIMRADADSVFDDDWAKALATVYKDTSFESARKPERKRGMSSDKVELPSRSEQKKVKVKLMDLNIKTKLDMSRICGDKVEYTGGIVFAPIDCFPFPM